MAKKNANPWLNRAWRLIAVSGPTMSLMVRRKRPRKGDNEFRFVAGSKSGSRILYYKVKFKKGAMTAHWNNCVLVPRGTDPVALIDRSGVPIPPLTAGATEMQISAIATTLVRAIDQNDRINASRLECDVELPSLVLSTTTGAFAPTGKKEFGQLRLFQVPQALGPLRLLVLDFAIQGGLPGGSGGGGSVTP